MGDDLSIEPQSQNTSPSHSAADEVELHSVPCRHLRNKGMLVYTDAFSSDAHGDSGNTIYWCVQTMKGFGPDDDMVCKEDCTLVNRSCYEPL
jgi:hypothetical protein